MQKLFLNARIFHSKLGFLSVLQGIVRSPGYLILFKYPVLRTFYFNLIPLRDPEVNGIDRRTNGQQSNRISVPFFPFEIRNPKTKI